MQVGGWLVLSGVHGLVGEIFGITHLAEQEKEKNRKN